MPFKGQRRTCPPFFFLKALRLLALLLALTALSSTLVLAHGTGWEQKELGDSTAIYFFYSDGTPMSYSSVSLFSPEDAEIPYQKANTDRSGWFVFKPSVPGLWKFSASDGQGHLSAGEIEIEAQAPASSPAPASAGAGEEGPGSGGSGDLSPASDTPSPPASPPPSKPLASSRARGPSPGIPEALLGLSLILNLSLAAFLFRKKRTGNA